MSTLGIIAIVVGCIIGMPFIITALSMVVCFICGIICLIIEAIEDIF